MVTKHILSTTVVDDDLHLDYAPSSAGERSRKRKVSFRDDLVTSMGREREQPVEVSYRPMPALTILLTYLSA